MQVVTDFGEKRILLPKNFTTEPLALLTDYFRRDGVEKFFDTLKNEMDSKRGRVQSQETFDGRLFIHMIGLIIYGEMQKRIKQNAKPLKCTMTFSEIILNLKCLKRLYSNDGTVTLGELTAKQKTIFKLLEIPSFGMTWLSEIMEFRYNNGVKEPYLHQYSRV